MLLAVAALAYGLFCHKLILVTFHLDGGTKVEVSSFSSPDIKVSFIATALLWINVAVAKAKYFKEQPSFSIRFTQCNSTKDKKVIWRESHST